MDSCVDACGQHQLDIGEAAPNNASDVQPYKYLEPSQRRRLHRYSHVVRHGRQSRKDAVNVCRNQSEVRRHEFELG